MATETQEVIQREAPEIEAYKIGLMEQAKALTSAPPTGGLPSVTAEGMTQAGQDALSAAQSGLGAYQPYLTAGATTMGAALPAYQAGMGLIGQAAGTYGAGMGAPTQAQMQAYMNPYQQAIQDEINRAYDIQATQAASQAVGQPGGPSAFGGSRAEIAQREINRNRAQALAQSQAQNFLQAQQASQQELNRALQAAQGIGQLGGVQAGLAQGIGQLGLGQASLSELGSKIAQSEIGQLAQLGEQERQILQQQAEAQRATDLQTIYEPYQRLGFYSDILRGAPSTQQTISTASAPQPGFLNQLLGAGIGGLSLYGAANKAFG